MPLSRSEAAPRLGSTRSGAVASRRSAEALNPAPVPMSMPMAPVPSALLNPTSSPLSTTILKSAASQLVHTARNLDCSCHTDSKLACHSWQSNKLTGAPTKWPDSRPRAGPFVGCRWLASGGETRPIERATRRCGCVSKRRRQQAGPSTSGSAAARQAAGCVEIAFASRRLVLVYSVRPRSLARRLALMTEFRQPKPPAVRLPACFSPLDGFVVGMRTNTISSLVV
jgi:hypothetical protein